MTQIARAERCSLSYLVLINVDTEKTKMNLANYVTDLLFRQQNVDEDLSYSLHCAYCRGRQQKVHLRLAFTRVAKT